MGTANGDDLANISMQDEGWDIDCFQVLAQVGLRERPMA